MRLCRYCVTSLVLAFSATAACDSEPAGPAVGALRISTSTVGADVPSSYYASVQGALGWTGHPMSAHDVWDLSELAVGEYTVELATDTPNCTVAGDNPRTLSVEAGQTAETTFEVSCTALTGALQVTTVTVGDTLDPDGYTVTLDDVTAEAIPINGSVTFSALEPGSHSVELGGVARNCSVSGENRQTATVTAGATTQVSFGINCEAPLIDYLAYVTNSSDNTVSVIATTTNTVVATIAVGHNPSGVATTPDGAFAYVTNQGGTVSVIETVTHTVVATVPVGAFAVGVAITPDGAFAYVTNSGPDNVSVISTATNTVVETIDVGPGSPVAVAITPDGAFAYVSHAFPPVKVSVISTATNTVVDEIDVGLGAWGLAITPYGAFVYVAVANFPGGVAVIATATNTVVTTLNVGFRASHVAITPDGAFAYVTNSMVGGPVSVIATASGTAVATLYLEPNVRGVAIRPDGAFAYVAHAPGAGGNGTVFVISTATNTVVATVGVGSWPSGIAITPVKVAIETGSIHVAATLAGGSHAPL